MRNPADTEPNIMSPELFSQLLKVELSGETSRDNILEAFSDPNRVLPFTLTTGFKLYLGIHPHEIKRHHNIIPDNEQLFLRDLFIHNYEGDETHLEVAHLPHNREYYNRLIKVLGCEPGNTWPYYEIMIQKIKAFVNRMKQGENM